MGSQSGCMLLKYVEKIGLGVAAHVCCLLQGYICSHPQIMGCLFNKHQIFFFIQALDSIKKSLPRKISDSKKKGKDKGASESKKDKDKAGPSFSEDDAKRLEKEVSCVQKTSIS